MTDETIQDVRREAEYLWDPAASPDPEIASLEQALAPARCRRAEAPRLEIRRGGSLRALALAAAVALAALGAWALVPHSAPPGGVALTAWPVETEAGTATIDAAPLAARGQFAVGQVLETPDDTRVRVEVADIGDLTVHPNSRLRLLRSEADREHRVELVRGRIDAMIFAPPRLFFVNTPAAVAVDLGCAYTLAVDDAGDGLIEVTLGWVALEAGPRTVTIPSGALCRISAERGPGTPWLEDAPPALVEALHRFDANDDRATALDVLLHAVRDRDTLTLFHLIPQTSGPARARVVDRMIAFAPLPDGVDRAAVERLEPAALDAWWSLMGYGW